ncbi:MAG: HEPN domain-containing protein [Thermodesulfovibrionales bacterium]
MGKELAEAEIEVAKEKLEAFVDDRRARRWGNATVNLYFALEHLVKALLASAGIEAKSHEGLKILFSMHFIKPGAISPKIGRYLGNLYDRRVTAEYSPLRRNEFTEEEVNTFLDWTKESFEEILPLLERNGIDVTALRMLIKSL